MKPANRRRSSQRAGRHVRSEGFPLDTIAVIDFETTGLSPAHGERATEIAAVLVREGRTAERRRAYRALADAEMAAHLTLYLERELQRRFGLATVTYELLERIQKVPKSGLQKCVERYGSTCSKLCQS